MFATKAESSINRFAGKPGEFTEKFNKENLYANDDDKLHFNIITGQVDAELAKALGSPNGPDETTDETIGEIKQTLRASTDGTNERTDEPALYRERIDELGELSEVGELESGRRINELGEHPMDDQPGQVQANDKLGVAELFDAEVDRKIIEKLDEKINEEREGDLWPENKLKKDKRRQLEEPKLAEARMTQANGQTTRSVLQFGTSRRAVGPASNQSFALIKEHRLHSRLTMNHLKSNPIGEKPTANGSSQPAGNSSSDQNYCDPKFFFDCTLGNLSANLSNQITLTRQQTNHAQLSSDLIVQDSFPLCIPINQKCDSVVNCPNAADESELICGESIGV